MAKLRVLLRGNAQQRPSHPHSQPIKRLVDRRVVGNIVSIQVEHVTNFSHVLQPIRCFTVSVVVFDLTLLGSRLLIAVAKLAPRQ